MVKVPSSTSLPPTADFPSYYVETDDAVDVIFNTPTFQPGGIVVAASGSPAYLKSCFWCAKEHRPCVISNASNTCQYCRNRRQACGADAQDPRFDRGSDILAHRMRLVRANRDSIAYLPVWARSCDHHPADLVARQEAEIILGKVASYGSWREALAKGIKHDLDDTVMEALRGDTIRGEQVAIHGPHPLVAIERDFWTTVTMPKDERKHGPRKLVKAAMYGDDMVVPGHCLPVMALPQAPPSAQPPPASNSSAVSSSVGQAAPALHASTSSPLAPSEYPRPPSPASISWGPPTSKHPP